MIAGFIFLLHIIAAVYGFIRYRKEGTGEGLLALAFVVIIFSVGWTITTMIAKIVYPADFVARWVGSLPATPLSRQLTKELSIDTFSLVLLTIGEIVFYYFYLRSGRSNKGQSTKVGTS